MGELPVSNVAFTLDITFCGDWAGNSYATSGCPGTWEERLQDSKNFEVGRALLHIHYHAM